MTKRLFSLTCHCRCFNNQKQKESDAQTKLHFDFQLFLTADAVECADAAVLCSCSPDSCLLKDTGCGSLTGMLPKVRCEKMLRLNLAKQIS